MNMTKWRAFLYYESHTHQFTLYARDYREAQDKISAIFPNIPYSLCSEYLETRRR